MANLGDITVRVRGLGAYSPSRSKLDEWLVDVTQTMRDVKHTKKKQNELFYFQKDLSGHVSPHRVDDSSSLASYNVQSGDVLETSSNPILLAACCAVHEKLKTEEQQFGYDDPKQCCPRCGSSFTDGKGMVRAASARKWCEGSCAHGGMRPLLDEGLIRGLLSAIGILNASTKKSGEAEQNKRQGWPPKRSVTELQELMDATYGLGSRAQFLIKPMLLAYLSQRPADTLESDFLLDSEGITLFIAAQDQHLSNKQPLSKQAQPKRPALLCTVGPKSTSEKKGYEPKPSSAPAAFLIGMYKALQQHEYSLSEDEAKQAAQPFTNSDLWDKSSGSYRSGGDSLQDLVNKGLIKRENDHSKFHLTKDSENWGGTLGGRELGRLLAEAHDAHDQVNSIRFNRVDSKPAGKVSVLVDSKEPQRDRMVQLLQRAGIGARIEDLPVDRILSFVIERKTWDDLCDSLSQNDGRRFFSQVYKMSQLFGSEHCRRVYLVEGSLKTRSSQKYNKYTDMELIQTLDMLRVNHSFHTVRSGATYQSVVQTIVSAVYALENKLQLTWEYASLSSLRSAVSSLSTSGARAEVTNSAPKHRPCTTLDARGPGGFLAMLSDSGKRSSLATRSQNGLLVIKSLTQAESLSSREHHQLHTRYLRGEVTIAEYTSQLDGHVSAGQIIQPFADLLEWQLCLSFEHNIFLRRTEEEDIDFPYGTHAAQQDHMHDANHAADADLHDEDLRRAIELSKRDSKADVSCGPLQKSKSQTAAEMWGVQRATARSYLDENERASPQVAGQVIQQAAGAQVGAKQPVVSNNRNVSAIKEKVNLTQEEYLRLSEAIAKKVHSVAQMAKEAVVSWALEGALLLDHPAELQQAGKGKKIRAVLRKMREDGLLDRQIQNGSAVLVAVSNGSEGVLGKCVVLDHKSFEDSTKHNLPEIRQKPPDVVNLDDTQSDEDTECEADDPKPQCIVNKSFEGSSKHNLPEIRQKAPDIVNLDDTQSDEATEPEADTVNLIDSDDDDDDDDDDCTLAAAAASVQRKQKTGSAGNCTAVRGKDNALRKVIELSKRDSKADVSCGPLQKSQSQTAAEMWGVQRATARSYLDENERASPQVAGQVIQQAAGAPQERCNDKAQGAVKALPTRPTSTKPADYRCGKDSDKHADAKRKSEDALNQHRRQMAAKFQRDKQAGNAFASPTPGFCAPSAAGARLPTQPSPRSSTPSMPWMSPAAGSARSVTPQRDSKTSTPQSQNALPKQCECGSYTHKTRNSMDCPLMHPTVKRQKLEQQQQRKIEKEEQKMRDEADRAHEQSRLRLMAQQLTEAAEALEPKKKKRKKS